MNGLNHKCASLQKVDLSLCYFEVIFVQCHGFFIFYRMSLMPASNTMPCQGDGLRARLNGCDGWIIIEKGKQFVSVTAIS